MILARSTGWVGGAHVAARRRHTRRARVIARHTVRRRRSTRSAITLRDATARITHRRTAGVAHGSARAAWPTGFTRRRAGSARSARRTREAINAARIAPTSGGRHAASLRANRVALVTHRYKAEAARPGRRAAGRFRPRQAAGFALTLGPGTIMLETVTLEALAVGDEDATAQLAALAGASGNPEPCPVSSNPWDHKRGHTASRPDSW